MINMLIFIMILFITVIVASKIVDSMIQSNVARNLVKAALGLMLFHTMGWVSLLAFVGYSVVQYKRARIAINNIKNIVHSMITR